MCIHVSCWQAHERVPRVCVSDPVAPSAPHLTSIRGLFTQATDDTVTILFDKPVLFDPADIEVPHALVICVARSHALWHTLSCTVAHSLMHCVTLFCPTLCHADTLCTVAHSVLPCARQLCHTLLPSCAVALLLPRFLLLLHPLLLPHILPRSRVRACVCMCVCMYASVCMYVFAGSYTSCSRGTLHGAM